MAKNNREQLEEPEIVSNPEMGSVDSTDAAGDESMVLARDVYPQTLPLIPIAGHPMFPRITVPIVIDNDVLARMLVDLAKASKRHVGIVLRKDGNSGEPGPPKPEDLHRVGVLAEIVQLAQAGESTVHVMLNTLERFGIVELVQQEPHYLANVKYLLETDPSDSPEIKAYSISVVKSIKQLVELNPLHKEELSLFMQHTDLSEPGRLADIAAALTTASADELQEILETVNVRTRLRKVVTLLNKEIDVSRIQVKISKQIDEKVSRQQREFFLREQLKAIKKELGIEKEGKQAEVERFEERLARLTLPPEADERVHEELDKLRLLEPISPEFNVSRNYLEWLTSLPWGIATEDSFDIAGAARVLDRDHYGLQDVKARILEFLAVGILKGRISGSILCFVGPPGVGKTSIGRSIATSIGRTFYRFSVGGIRDEAEIKGHRRTYIGALPGKFIQVMKSCKSSNPVIMLDEIDKIGASYQGDPASALLEVLDPEQNRDFLDHYLDVRFDLSNAFFICTANQLDTIPRPLLDRMEVINLAGYILKEKLEIARRYLVPKQRKANGVKRRQITIRSEALHTIIDGYAREPGVRSLEKQIGKIMRKTARRIVEEEEVQVIVEAGDVATLLGKRRFVDDPAMTEPTVGVVTGLAWTSMGGDTLPVEALGIAVGKAGFKQTGQLGDVMVESSEIAYSYVRRFLADDEEATDFFKNNSIHLHVPAGATPKDGPSAGITMASAIYSLVKQTAVGIPLAMTGELTLTGRVMPIGGLKEKTLAARRAKIMTLIFPEENRNDFDELPAHIRKGLTPHFVRQFAEVVALCFTTPAAAAPAASPGPARRGARRRTTTGRRRKPS